LLFVVESIRKEYIVNVAPNIPQCGQHLRFNRLKVREFPLLNEPKIIFV